MKARRRSTARQALRAVRLRAMASDAARALEAWDGDTGPEAHPDHRAKFDQLVMVAAERNRAADAAEKRLVEASHQCGIERAARVAREKVAAQSGTDVKQVRDGADVHRFARCACGAAVRFWSDPAEVWGLGWGSAWVGVGTPEARRVWTCPECWEAPATSRAEARIFRFEDKVVARMTAALKGGAFNRARRRIERLLAQLAEVDPEMGRAWRQRIGT